MNDNQYIICYGEVLWDMLPTGAKPGGAPLNVAIHLKKHGNHPKLISKIGNDENGKGLLWYLEQEKVDTTFIGTDPALPTSKVVVHLDQNRNASYEICEPVAWDNIEFNPAIAALAKNAKQLIFGSLALRNPTSLNTLLSLAKITDAEILFDVNLRPPFYTREMVEKLLNLADFVKLNNDELAVIAQWNKKDGTEAELINWLAKHYNCQTICVTRGENGAALFMDSKLYEHPGFTVNVADTVGAGDSFFASIISGLNRGINPEEALITACATGAFVASQKGAVPNYTRADIEKIIESSPC